MDLPAIESAVSANTPDADATAARPSTARVRDLTPGEIAGLNIETVAKNNSASLEELVDNNLATGQLFVDVGN